MLVLYVHVHVVYVVNMYMIGTYNIGDFRHILLFSQDFEVRMGRIVLYLRRKFVSFPPLFTDFFIFHWSMYSQRSVCLGLESSVLSHCYAVQALGLGGSLVGS